MKFMGNRTESEWRSISAEELAEADAKKEASVTLAAFESFVLDILLSENLIVLCGLGTSRCVRDAAGNEAGPTMPELWAAAKAKAGENFAAICEK